MKCQDFEKLVVEIADGRLLEVATRERLTAHAGECRSCAARLAFERSLTGHLKTMARADSMIKTPEAVKRELMAAFAERRNAPPSRVFSLIRQIPQQNSWGLAAAAVVLLTVSATTGIWLGMNQHHGGDPGAKPQPIVTTPPSATKPPILAPSVRAMAAEVPAEHSAQPDRVDQAAENMRRAKIAANRKARDLALAVSEENEEAATDYLPLTAVAPAEPAEMQQVVRVEVPRSMLLMWGVPVNTDRTRTSVKADLVIGEDGVARAIRLVN